MTVRQTHLDRSTIVRTRADSRLVPATKHHKTNFPLPVCFTAGGYGAGDPPDPIPNSEVKTRCADGTAGATRWESTAPPANYQHRPLRPHGRGGLCCFCVFRICSSPKPRWISRGDAETQRTQRGGRV